MPGLRTLPQPAPVQPHVSKPALVNRQVNMLGDIWQVKAVEDAGGLCIRKRVTNTSMHTDGNHPIGCLDRLQNNFGVTTSLFPVVVPLSWELSS